MSEVTAAKFNNRGNLHKILTHITKTRRKIFSFGGVLCRRMSFFSRLGIHDIDAACLHNY